MKIWEHLVCTCSNSSGSVKTASFSWFKAKSGYLRQWQEMRQTPHVWQFGKSGHVLLASLSKSKSDFETPPCYFFQSRHYCCDLVAIWQAFLEFCGFVTVWRTTVAGWRVLFTILCTQRTLYPLSFLRYIYWVDCFHSEAVLSSTLLSQLALFLREIKAALV